MIGECRTLRLSALSMCLLFLLPPLSGTEPPLMTTAADRAAVAVGNNAFAVDLYRQLQGQDGNLFFSPESLSTALAMAYAGARGTTAEAMAKTLQFTLPANQLHPAMGALLNDLNAAHAGYELSVADALWAQRGATFLPDFLAVMKDNYGAGFNQVDFKTSTEAARLTINRWVEEKTANNIKDLLRTGALRPTTRLVLTNAIYFKGDWQTPFDKAETRSEDFHVSPASTIQAPLMHRTGSFAYYNGGSFQALEMPYKNNELSMVVLLPNAEDGLRALEESLTADRAQHWMDQLASVPKVIVTLPKFKMTQEFELGRVLGAMGMAEAFGKAADFSGMTGQRDFAISAVIHRAYIDVNEEGTEAAAATAVTMRSLAMRANPVQPPVFRADHPFLFLIRDLRSHSILFMGRETHPASE